MYLYVHIYLLVKFSWLIKYFWVVLRLLTALIFAVKLYCLNEKSCLILWVFILVPLSHISGVGLAVCIPESNHPHSHFHTSWWLSEFHRPTGSWNTPHYRHSTGINQYILGYPCSCLKFFFNADHVYWSNESMVWQEDVCWGGQLSTMGESAG